jgi:hypothetical protein
LDPICGSNFPSIRVIRKCAACSASHRLCGETECYRYSSRFHSRTLCPEVCQEAATPIRLLGQQRNVLD